MATQQAKYQGLKDISGIEYLQWGVHNKFDHNRMLQYHKFILCKFEARDFEVDPLGRFRLSPTAEIDEVWHDHMLRPTSYFRYMKWLSGGDADNFVNHDPDFEDDSEQEKLKRHHETCLVWRKLFGEDFAPKRKRGLEVDLEEEVDLENDDVITVYGKTMTGRILECQVKPSCSILQLKELIEDLEYIPVDQIRLIFAGKQLENDRLLSEYRIQHDSTIHIALRSRGC